MFEAVSKINTGRAGVCAVFKVIWKNIPSRGTGMSKCLFFK